MKVINLNGEATLVVLLNGHDMPIYPLNNCLCLQIRPEKLLFFLFIFYIFCHGQPGIVASSVILSLRRWETGGSEALGHPWQP